MVLEIHQDDDLRFSAAAAPRRKVSFQMSSTPLTPHNKQANPRRAKLTKTPKPVTKTRQESATAMLPGKENATSTRTTNIRRSIRSTMSPKPIGSGTATAFTTKQHQQQPKKPVSVLKTPSRKSNHASTTTTTTTTPSPQQSAQRTPLSSVLRRSMMNSGRKLGPPQRVRTTPPTTPTSMLQNEMKFDDPDMSLLISPSAISNPNDNAPSPRNDNNTSRFGFRMSINDSILEEEVATPSGVTKSVDVTHDADMSLLISPSAMNNPNDVVPSPRISRFGFRMNVNDSILEEEVSTPSGATKHVEVTHDADMSMLISPSAMGNPNNFVPSHHNETPHSATRIASKILQSVNDSIMEEEEETIAQPAARITARGKGVQMDLSEMFSGLDSPVKGVKSVEATPTISANSLRQGVVLDFGDDRANVVGQARTLPFVIEAAPDATRDLFLEIEKIPFVKGISLAVSDPSSTLLKGLTPSIKSHQKNKKQFGGPAVPNMLNVKQGDKATLWVTWTPVEAGGIRELILLKLPKGPGRLRVTILGKAGEAKKTKKTRFSMTPAQPTKSRSRVFSTAKKDHFTPAKMATPGVSSSRLSRVSPGAPISSAMKVKASISIPEDWAEKQCNAFTEWLNYMFQPTEDLDHELILKQVESGHAGSHQTMNRAALRTLVVHQRLAQARTRALQVFHTPDMKKARKVIIAEIARGRLSLRTDRDIHADLSLRSKVVSLLLSYSTPWLRIGLEVMFGEPICVETPASQPLPTVAKENRKGRNKPPMSRMKLTLKHVIVTRLLADPETLRKYTRGRCNVPSGRFEKQYRDEIRILILTRLLVLVAFLDKAKLANVLDRVPRLFTKESKVKSTRDVLVSLCREFLSSEGDIIKHLSRIGLKVTYKQEPIDELDFTVTNLAADIRDGVRLARMEEILTDAPAKSLLATLRLPAVSRLQKLHNVGAVLSILGDRGVPDIGDVAAHHIVDGYREQVLKLLWTVVANCGIGVVLDPSAVEKEISKVEHINRTRLVNWGLQRMASVSKETAITLQDNGSHEQEIRNLLLQWSNTVISPFGVKVSDYTASFADGIAICLLIHYYHPGLIRLDEIKPTSRHGLHIDEALMNERLNLTLASERMSELGGIPKLLPMGDSKNPPEEKSMLLCLVYLCSRLMESSTEVLACQSIQNWYRRKKRIELMGKKIKASTTIWETWAKQKAVFYQSQELKYGESVRAIEAFVFANKDRLHALRDTRELREMQVKCATEIQAQIRKRQAQKKIRPLLRRNSSALTIQKNWRISQIYRALEAQRLRRFSASAIQKAWRGHYAFSQLSILLWGVTRLQALVRGYNVRKGHGEEVRAAVHIQRIWRGFMCQVLLQVDLLDVVTVQGIARRYLALKLRIRKMASVIKLQQFFRRVLAVKHLNKMRNDQRIEMNRLRSVILLQRNLRGYLTRREFDNKTVCCVRIQAAVRGFLLRSMAETYNSSTLLLQTSWRQHAQRTRFLHSRGAIVEIQTFVRRFLKQSKLQLAESSAVQIQATWRKFSKQMEYAEITGAALSLQCFFRLKLAAQTYESRKQAVTMAQKQSAALLVQTSWRRFVKRVEYDETIASAILIQCVCRLKLAARAYESKKQAFIAVQQQSGALLIQTYWRRFIKRADYQKAILSAISIQCAFRLKRAVRVYEGRRYAVVVVQKHLRRWKASQVVELARMKHRALVQAEKERNSVIRIQSLVRRMRSISRVDQIRQTKRNLEATLWWSVVLIQGFTRLCLATTLGYTVNRDTVALQEQRSAVVVQSSARRYLAVREVAKRRNHQYHAAACIQKQARAHIASVRFIAAIDAVTILQRTFRGAKVRAKIGHCTSNARIIQTVWKAFYLKKIASIAAATTMQKILRGTKVRRDIAHFSDSARTIQSAWRMCQLKTTYNCSVRSVVLMQSVVRRHISKNAADLRSASVLAIQMFGRVALAKALVEKLICEKVNLMISMSSATRIQASLRGYQIRRLLESRNAAAIIVQREWKCFIAFLQYQSDLIDIVIVQSIIRRRQGQMQARRKVCAITIIQLAARQWLASMHAKNVLAQKIAEWGQQQCAAIKIQSIIRGHISKSLLQQHKAAIRIQKTWRCFFVHVDYIMDLIDIMTIQRCAKKYVKRRRLARATPGIIAAQSLFRGFLDRKFVVHRLNAAVTIQSGCRRFLVQDILRAQGEAATIIQKNIRGHLDRIDLQIQSFAAVEIQRVWRGFLDRVEAMYYIVMVLRIQSAARRHLATREMHQRRLELAVDHRFYHYTARTIQRSVREYLVQQRFEKAACTLQRVVRGILARRHVEKYVVSAVQIQAYIRAYRVRRTRTKKATVIVIRLTAARQRAIQNPGLILGVRTQFALKELQTSQRLTEIMEAAKILETSTRLSRNCCVAFVRVGAPNILYDLIGSCNRSLPHIEILRYVLLTLRNVSSQKDLLQDVATSKSAEIFLDLVQMFRDKQEVFHVALILLSRVARKNQDLKRLCSKAESMKRLNHVLKKVSITTQSRQDISRVSRGRTSFLQQKESVKTLRSLLKFLKE